MKTLRGIGLLITLTAGTAAQAGFSPIGGSGEANFVQILNAVYGGSFAAGAPAPFGALSYTNGAYALTRIDDFGVGSPMQLATGGPGTADDQRWADGVVNARAEARYAGFSQEFGYYNGTNPATYTKLFDVSGSGTNVSGSIASYSFGSAFGFARGGNNGPHFSRDLDNADGRDHMLTYRVTGPGGYQSWLLFFEDKNQGDSGADFDYNDLVVEVSVIPAPGAIALGLFGLAGAGWLRRRLAA